MTKRKTKTPKERCPTCRLYRRPYERGIYDHTDGGQFYHRGGCLTDVARKRMMNAAADPCST